jgi:DNA-directed RNA polymerase specialized sigma24 family protein
VSASLAKLREAVAAALDRLSADHREIVRLRVVDELDYSVIGRSARD